MYGRGGGYGGGPFGGGFGGGLSITPMVRNIIIANVFVYILTLQSPDLVLLLSVNSFSFRPWQPFTYMWLHDIKGLAHIAFNMLALWFFGRDLERAWGSQRFLVFYLACGAGAGFIIWIADLISSPSLTLGASGAVYGVVTAFTLQWPNRTIGFFGIPMRAMYLIPVMFLLQLSMGGNVSHVGHLGGILVAVVALRQTFTDQFQSRGHQWNLRYQWKRFVMRNRLRAVRREQSQRRRSMRDDDDHPPTIH